MMYDKVLTSHPRCPLLSRSRWEYQQIRFALWDAEIFCNARYEMFKDGWEVYGYIWDVGCKFPTFVELRRKV